MAEQDDRRLAQLERRVEELERQLALPADLDLASSRRIEGTGRFEPPAPKPVTTNVSGAPARRPLTVNDLLGARALAYVGGSVLLLGLAFFLAIAIDRGWIGEQMRVALGAGTSTILLAWALHLQRTYGRMDAAHAAAGVAIGGFHLTLLAAGPLYELIPEETAIGLGLIVGAGAVALSLRWSAELIGLIGLGGAISGAPLVVDGVEVTSLVAIAISVAVSALLSVKLGWWRAAVACAILSAPQVLSWISDSSDRDAVVWAMLAVFTALYLTAGLGHELARLRFKLHPGPTLLVIGSAGFVLSGMALFYDGRPSFDGSGLVIGFVGLLYVSLVLPVSRLAGNPATPGAANRDLHTLLWATGLAVLASGMLIAFQGQDACVAFSVGAVLLAVAARTFSEERLVYGSCAYLALATIFMMAEAEPTLLFDGASDAGEGVLSVLIVATCATAVALITPVLRIEVGLLAGSLVIYCASLALVAVLSTPDPAFNALGDVGSDFQRAQTLVSIFWGVVGLSGLLLGLRRGWPAVRLAGFALLGLALGKVFLYDLSSLTTFARALSFLGLGALLLVGAFLYARSARDYTGESR